MKPTFGRRVVENLDWILLGVLAIAAIFVVVSGTGSGGGRADAGIAAAGAVTADIERRMAATATRVSSVLPSERLDRIRSAWLRPAEARRLPDHVFHAREALEDARAGRSLEVRLEPPGDLAATASVGSIRLTWAMATGSTVPVSGYRIHRAVGNGPPEAIADVEAAALEYNDTGVRGGTDYSYTVSTLTADIALVAAGKGESSPSAPVLCRGLSDIEWKLVRIDESAGRARFLVRRWHEKSWRDKEFDAIPDGEVGELDPATGVDYRTGRRVVSLKVEKRPVTRTRREHVFEDDGRVAIADGRARVEEVRLEGEFEVELVTLRGPDGIESEVSRPRE